MSKEKGQNAVSHKKGHGVSVFRVGFITKKSEKKVKYQSAVVVADNAMDAVNCSAEELGLHISTCCEVSKLNTPEEAVFLAI